MSAAKPPVKVQPGQVWADKDRRSAGRTVRVLEIDGRHAIVQSPTGLGRKSRVLHDENGLRGYRLVTDAEVGA